MKLRYDPEALRRFCRERGIARLELFGSALRDDFGAGSDVDLLCTLREDPKLKCGLFEWMDIQFQLEAIFDRPVDLVSRWAIERSRNERRKHSILRHTLPLYAEG